MVVDWICKVQWQALVNAVKNVWVPLKAKKCFMSSMMIGWLCACLLSCLAACLLDSLGAWSVWEAVSQPFSQVFMALFYVSWNTHMTKVQQIFHYFTSQINSSVIIRLYSLTDKCSTKSTQHTGAWNNCSLLSHCSYSFSLIMNKQTSIFVEPWFHPSKLQLLI